MRGRGGEASVGVCEEQRRVLGGDDRVDAVLRLVDVPRGQQHPPVRRVGQGPAAAVLPTVFRGHGVVQES
jgi:hypothetical protein